MTYIKEVTKLMKSQGFELHRTKLYDRYVACKGMDNRKDPVASAMGLHGQIVFYDNSNDSIVKSFDRAGKTLKSLMKEYNEQAGFDRFNV